MYNSVRLIFLRMFIFRRKKSEQYVEKPAICVSETYSEEPVSKDYINRSMQMTTPVSTNESLFEDVMNTFENYQFVPDTIEEEDTAKFMNSSLPLSPKEHNRVNADFDRSAILGYLQESVPPAIPSKQLEPDLRIYKTMREFTTNNDKLHSVQTPSYNYPQDSNANLYSEPVISHIGHSTQDSYTQPRSAMANVRVVRDNALNYSTHNNLNSSARIPSGETQMRKTSDSSQSNSSITSKPISLPPKTRVPAQNQSPRARSVSTNNTVPKVERKEKSIRSATSSTRKSGRPQFQEPISIDDSDDEPLIKSVTDRRQPESQGKQSSEVSSPKSQTMTQRPIGLPTADLNLSPEQQQQMLMMYYTQMALMQQTTQMQGSLKTPRQRRKKEVTHLDSEVTVVDADLSD